MRKYYTIKISGKQGSGKTTTANELENLFQSKGITAYRIKFADALYEMHDLLLNFMEKRTGLVRAKKDGHLLQLLGTDWGRKTFGQDVWADIVNHEIHDIIKTRGEVYKDTDHAVFIIDDCRFKNEFDTVKGFNVRLTCDKETRKERAESWRENDTHPSEIDLDEYATSGLFNLNIKTGFDQVKPKRAAEIIYDAVSKLY